MTHPSPADKPAADDASPPASGGLPFSLAQALDEYVAALQAGQAVDQEAFLARFPHLREALADCLTGLELVQHWKTSGDASSNKSASTDANPAWETDGLSAVHAALGDYRILREIGRGGMGVVYAAEQLSLQRQVALKVLPLAAVLDPRQLARFKNEVRAAATLDHRGIVAVHAVGCEQGVHFFAMQLIDGPSLAEVIAQLRNESQSTHPPDTPPTRPASAASTVSSLSRTGSSREYFRYVARLGIQVAEALEHAHQHGIIHRDIKPANLLLDSQGYLRIADFGLARIEADVGLTMTGDLLGTLRYTSPEQALGRPTLVDHRTDIYSLGVTLYELLTLRPAFAATDRQQLLQQIALHDPPAPRQVNRDIPPDLETVVLASMAKEPAERYASAGDMAEDLRRFLAGQPILARRAGLADRLRKFVQRHQALVGSATIILLVIAVASLASVLSVLNAWRSERQLRQRAEQLRQVAESQTERFEELLYVDRMQLAGTAWGKEDMLQVVDLLEPYQPQPNRRDWRGFEWHFLDQAARWQAETLAAYDAALYDVSFSPDGQWMATAGADGTVRFHDTATGKLGTTIEAQQGETNCVQFSPQGTRVVTAGDDGTVKLWDWPGRNLLWSVQAYQKPAYFAAFTPDGSKMATCGDEPPVRLWDTVTGESLGLLEGHTGAVERICFSPDGNLLGSAGRDRTLRLWAWKARRLLFTFETGAIVPSLVFVPDSSWVVAVGQSSRFIMSWSTRTGEQLHFFPEPQHRDDLRSLALSSDGRLAATGDSRGSIRLWQIPAESLHPERETTDRPPLIRWRIASLHAGRVYGLAFAPDGSHLVSAGQDGKLMRLAAPESVRHFRRIEGVGLVHGLDSVADQSLLAIAGSAGVKLIRTKDGVPVQTLTEEGSDWQHVSVHPSGDWLAASTNTGEVRVWELPSGTERYRDHPAQGESKLAWVPGTSRLSLSDVTTPWIDPQHGLMERSYPAEPAQCIAYAPDGQHVAIARPVSNAVEIWNWKTGAQRSTLPDAGIALDLLRYSPSGRWLAAVRGGRHLIVWDAAQEVRHFASAAHDNSIMDLCFTPDERGLITAGDDGRIQLWHLPTGSRLFDLVSRRRTGIYAIALGDEGEYLSFIADPDYSQQPELFIGAGVVQSAHTAAPQTE